MDKLLKIKTKIEDLEGLPLFCRIIYYNKITYIEDELKLYSFSPEIQSEVIRNYFPNRKICKINFNEDYEENEKD